VEASVAVHGVPVTLLDTAGIRTSTMDAVELLGIERSHAAASGADVVLMVVSAQDGWTREDGEVHAALLAGLGERPLLLAVNKVDQAAGPPLACVPALLASSFHGMVGTSAVRREGVSELEDVLAELLGVGRLDAEGGAWAANQRQAEALEQARCALERLQTAVQAGYPVDCWCVELREAATALGEVTGTDIGEGVLDTIFAEFCIGK
jgi:tRNA modification GTPase